MHEKLTLSKYIVIISSWSQLWPFCTSSRYQRNKNQRLTFAKLYWWFNFACGFQLNSGIHEINKWKWGLFASLWEWKQVCWSPWTQKSVSYVFVCHWLMLHIIKQHYKSLWLNWIHSGDRYSWLVPKRHQEILCELHMIIQRHDYDCYVHDYNYL